jgi:hypothetical protein
MVRAVKREPLMIRPGFAVYEIRLYVAPYRGTSAREPDFQAWSLPSREGATCAACACALTAR